MSWDERCRFDGRRFVGRGAITKALELIRRGVAVQGSLAVLLSRHGRGRLAPSVLCASSGRRPTCAGARLLCWSSGRDSAAPPVTITRKL